MITAEQTYMLLIFAYYKNTRDTCLDWVTVYLGSLLNGCTIVSDWKYIKYILSRIFHFQKLHLLSMFENNLPCITMDICIMFMHCTHLDMAHFFMQIPVAPDIAKADLLQVFNKTCSRFVVCDLARQTLVCETLSQCYGGSVSNDNNAMKTEISSCCNINEIDNSNSNVTINKSNDNSNSNGNSNHNSTDNDNTDDRCESAVQAVPAGLVEYHIIIMDTSNASAGTLPNCPKCDSETEKSMHTTNKCSGKYFEKTNGTLISVTSMHNFVKQVHLQASVCKLKGQDLKQQSSQQHRTASGHGMLQGIPCNCKLAKVYIPQNPQRHVASLIFTSGSSGKPKGVIYTDKKL